MAGQVAVEAARRRPPLHIAALSKRPELDSRPSSTVPYALPRLEELAIDLGRLQRRRDHLIPALAEMGYETSPPEGTFYTMVRSPIPADLEFARQLRRHGVLVLPGTIVEVPGWFRVSLTANDEMVERGIDGFRRALDAVAAGPRSSP